MQSLRYQFFSAEDILQHAVCAVTTYKFHGPNSVYDPRMGVSRSTETCMTCLGTGETCPGHYGYIDLVEPIVNPIARTALRDRLKLFCFFCARTLLPVEDAKRTYYHLHHARDIYRFLDFFMTRCDKTRTCSFCNQLQPILHLHMDEKVLILHHNRSTKQAQASVPVVQLIPKDVAQWLARVHVGDLQVLGLEHAHPQHLLLQYLVVIPPVSRSSVQNGEYISDDDLTSQYVKILKACNALRRIAAPFEPGTGSFGGRVVPTYLKAMHVVEHDVRVLMENARGSNSVRVHWRFFKSVKDRLTGKEGHFRSNIMGKRVDFSGRTVITPNPLMRVDEVGVPREICETLTIPIPVNRYNYHTIVQEMRQGRIRSALRNGKRYSFTLTRQKLMRTLLADPGARCIRNGKLRVIANAVPLQYHDVIVTGSMETFVFGERTQSQTEIQIGDTVERYLRDGDLVLLNRQPTLHTGSMLAQRVRVVEHKTLQLSLAITKTFNADFDGDEMNIHVPQTVDAAVELELLSTVEARFINPQNSRPLLSIVQDALLGAYLLTLPSTRVPLETAFDLIVLIGVDVALTRAWRTRTTISGRELFSTLLPSDLHYEYRGVAGHESVRVENGVLVEGVINKSVLNDAKYSLVGAIYGRCGARRAMQFMDQVQWLCTTYAAQYGFSIRLIDCCAETLDLKAQVQHHLLQSSQPSLHALDSEMQEFEVNVHLNRAKDLGHRLAREGLARENAFRDCILSGSKGNFINLTQITGLLGQQNISGRRIQPQILHNQRALPHYSVTQSTQDVGNLMRMFESRGFIMHSFLEGLNPQEYFFHACSGREGVTDTACKTAIPGYLQRQKVKLLEDLQVHYDGTVRVGGRRGEIVQFRYGGNGLAPECVSRVGSGTSFVSAAEISAYMKNE